MNSSLVEATVSDQPQLQTESRGASRSLPALGLNSALGWARAFLLAVAAVFFALHFVNLSADFPNHSPWMDWSKYTDEGWYGDAAIRHFQRGQWYVPGDFNPGAALPVWPLLELAVFSLTGVSLVAARALTVAVFGATLVTAYALLQRGPGAGREPALAPEFAVLLLTASPFCFVFTRLAILEPLLVLLGLLALLVASKVPLDGEAPRWQRLAGPVFGLGLLLPLLVLTKTTAVFLLPSIAWMLWASGGYRLRPFLRVGVPAATIGAGIWAAYFAVFVRPKFLEDYRYLFSANAYTGMTRENWHSVVASTFRDGMWMGKLIYPLALIAVAAALLCWRRTFRDPLLPSLILWAAGYAAFLAYHNNLQPRYYLVIAVPLTLLAPRVAEQILTAGQASPDGDHRRGLRPVSIVAGAALVSVAVAVAVVDARQTIGYVRNPEFTYAKAAQEVRRIVAADNTHNPLVLSISGSDLSLMTGLPSICDDFGTMSLQERAAMYKPGWYATWNEVDDDKMDALAPLFHLERVAAFPALDDPERNLLILYRLDPPQGDTPRKKRRKPVPKLLETKMGQQPSTLQLEH